MNNSPAERRPTFFGLVGIFGLVLFFGFILSRLGLNGLGPVAAGTVGFVSSLIIGLVASVSSCMAVSGGLLVGTAAKYNERLGENTARGKSMTPTLLFVAGRLLSYALLGGSIGAIGQALDPSPLVYGLIILVAALTMLFLGLDMLHLLPRGLRRLMPRMPAFLGRKIMAAESSAHPAAPLALGAATFFLPCGFTQALQIYALSAGSFIAGAVVLGGFALGTAPALLALGWASGAFKGGFKRFFFRFAGAAIVVLGLSNVTNGLAVMGVDLSTADRTADTAVSDNVSSEKDVQVINMKVETYGYTPDNITIRAGLKTRWQIDATNATGCIRSLVSRSLGIKTILSAGANTIEFTAPSRPGVYAFSCSMGMYRGTINVIN